MLTEFSVALSEQQKSKVLEVAGQLYRCAGSGVSLMPSQVRDLYYKYLGKLDEYALSNHISLWFRDEVNSGSIWDSVMECITLPQLGRLLDCLLYTSRRPLNARQIPGRSGRTPPRRTRTGRF